MILTGVSASPGVGIEYVKIVRTADDLDKIQKGDVLVAEMTNPDYVSAMEKSVAIVTDQGVVLVTLRSWEGNGNSGYCRNRSCNKAIEGKPDYNS